MDLFSTTIILFIAILTMTTAHPTNLTSILIPLYIYPTPGAWDPLYSIITAYPTQPFTVIVNPDSGPGPKRFPDDSYIDGVVKLKVFKNVRVIGYVHASYTARKLEDVCKDVDTYTGWDRYPRSDISVDGIFVDEAPDNVGKDGRNLNYMKSVRSRILENFNGIGKSGFTMTNPGVIVDKRFYESSITDAVVSFEDTLKNYYAPGKLEVSKDMTKSPGTPSEMQAIIVTSVDGSPARERYILNKLVERGIGFVYFTTDPDYQKFGTDLAIFVDQVARSNGLVEGKVKVGSGL
ncbi:hypothetical protein TWF718_007661 [Orbilia javanica]|uniref:Spherulin-4 n=1 Tax=Orbilia javanica TaxID=47235 RepID=A0AAN8MPL7_9PEZI